MNDSLQALAGRFLTYHMKESFKGREDHGLERRLVTELPGILRLGSRRKGSRHREAFVSVALSVALPRRSGKGKTHSAAGATDKKNCLC